MRSTALSSALLLSLIGIAAAPGCGTTTELPPGPQGPGADATDQRVPALGTDLTILSRSKILMGAALTQVQTAQGPIIEAKFELDDSQKLSLSTYPLGMGLDVDAERNLFREYAGDPTATPFTGKLEVFADQEHLTRSARDLTLVQLSKLSLADAVAQAAPDGAVFWAVPTILKGRAGYGLYTASGNTKRYRFIDGNGPTGAPPQTPVDLGTGPGAAATDKRVPELGANLAVLATAKVTMAQGLESTEAKYGPAIEAKFELDDKQKLSLSIYPVGSGITTDAERNKFQELAGDPTVSPFAPTLAEFKVPDVEHLTRAARDLTLVQTAGLTLKAAVSKAQSALPDGFVFWAIPTIRDTRAGYGVYVYGKDSKVHYFFIVG